MPDSKRICELMGLGAVSERHLAMIGVDSVQNLIDLGPVEAFIRMRDHPELSPSMNFLYAMVGALEGRHWVNIARSERESLLMALEGFEEFRRALLNEGIDITL